MIDGARRLGDLMKLGADRSETSRRVTNLFVDPAFIEHGGAFLERGLVHRTTRGELVRSKSEVIVADLLDALGLPYAYEQPFTGSDGCGIRTSRSTMQRPVVEF